jgi:toxin HigB-1
MDPLHTGQFSAGREWLLQADDFVRSIARFWPVGAVRGRYQHPSAYLGRERPQGRQRNIFSRTPQLLSNQVTILIDWQGSRRILAEYDHVQVRITTIDVNNAYRYYTKMAIKSFKCADTETLFKLGRVKRFVNLERPALRKLKQLDLALRIDDMRAPPANRLEALKGGRAGQWSVRVNDQFRICFRWTDGAEGVEIVDYH